MEYITLVMRQRKTPDEKGLDVSIADGMICTAADMDVHALQMVEEARSLLEELVDGESTSISLVLRASELLDKWDAEINSKFAPPKPEHLGAA